MRLGLGINEKQETLLTRINDILFSWTLKVRLIIDLVIPIWYIYHCLLVNGVELEKLHFGVPFNGKLSSVRRRWDMTIELKFKYLCWCNMRFSSITILKGLLRRWICNHLFREGCFQSVTFQFSTIMEDVFYFPFILGENNDCNTSCLF